jgi:hypothetical protein
MYEYEENKENEKQKVIDDLIEKYDNPIQLDYINNYTDFNDIDGKNSKLSEYIPITNIIEKIYDNIKQCYNIKSEDDFYMYINNINISSINEKLESKFIRETNDINKIFNLSSPKIDNNILHYGNVDYSLVLESFKNSNFINSHKFLDEVENINKPFSVSTLNIDKFIGYILYLRARISSNYSTEKFVTDFLKEQINKDVLRQHTYINDNLINDKFPKNKGLDLLNVYANIFNLNLLEVIENKMSVDHDNDEKYNLMNICTISTIQHVVSWFSDSLMAILLNSNEINTSDDAGILMDAGLPENNEYYDNGSDNKFCKIYIDKQIQKINIIVYNNITTYSVLDLLSKKNFGNLYYVIEFDIPSNQVFLKYFCFDYNILKHNEWVNEIINLNNYTNVNINNNQNINRENINRENINRENINRENINNENINRENIISKNKGKVGIGSALGLMALSAIPIALLLGGKTKKCNKIKNKYRKNKQTRIHKKHKTHKKNKQYKKRHTKKYYKKYYKK